MTRLRAIVANCPVAETSAIIVRQGNRSTRIDCDPGQTILDALRRAAIPIPTQCEKAYCGSCMYQLIRGTVELRINDVLSDSDLAEGYRLACQGIPMGTDVEIELL